MQDVWSYIKDTGDFLKKTQTFRWNTLRCSTGNSTRGWFISQYFSWLGFPIFRFNETGICKVTTEEVIWNSKICSQKQLLWV